MQAVLQIDREGYKLYFAHNVFEASDIKNDLEYYGKTAIIIPLRDYFEEKENEKGKED